MNFYHEKKNWAINDVVVNKVYAGNLDVWNDASNNKDDDDDDSELRHC